MTFTLPRYIRQLPSELQSAELVEFVGDDAQYRMADFDGLSDHDKLLRKLAIMTMRGQYFICS